MGLYYIQNSKTSASFLSTHGHLNTAKPALKNPVLIALIDAKLWNIVYTLK